MSFFDLALYLGSVFGEYPLVGVYVAATLQIGLIYFQFFDPIKDGLLILWALAGALVGSLMKIKVDEHRGLHVAAAVCIFGAGLAHHWVGFALAVALNFVVFPRQSAVIRSLLSLVVIKVAALPYF